MGCLRLEPTEEKSTVLRCIWRRGDSTKSGVDRYDYGARMYDPALGRFHVPDPMQQYSSGYVYVDNNPISMIDPTGMWGEEFNGWEKTVIDDRGKVIYHDDDPNDKNIYYSPDGEKGKDGNVEGLDKVGTEKAGYNYVVGQEIPISHLSAQGIRIWFGEDFDVTVYSLTPEWEIMFLASDVVLLLCGEAAFLRPGTSSPKGYKGIRTRSSWSPAAKKAAKDIKGWLGEGYTHKKSPKGNDIFMSKDGTKKVRFDITDSHNDKPHIHFERKTSGGKWVDATDQHRIYPKQN
jgi:RHS repeat-associated protein